LIGVSTDDNLSPGRNSGTHTNRPNIEGDPTMRLGLNYIAPLLAAGAATAAIAAAPIAAAAPPAPGNTSQVQQSCAAVGGTQTECQSPGNVQVNDAPPQVDFFPYAGGAT
jgi:hypothetical protein